jgi:hypothetical protein
MAHANVAELTDNDVMMILNGWNQKSISPFTAEVI